MEFNGIIYTAFSSNDEIKQFHKYIDFDTRPRFPEDLPEGERKLAEEAEFIEYPVDIEYLSELECLYTLSYLGDFEVTNKVIVKLARFFNAKRLVVFIQNDEEFCEYRQYIPGENRLLYSYLSPKSPLKDSAIEDYLIEHQFDNSAFKKILETYP
ncbi:hypothetical protein [Pleionea mediterranea]|uniref:Uncharacterized protein n=1 Tax=Pleionea mediterranea TaxID=523701 RepID=A0A316G0Y8_9GAMM|nr:hypothetical protein [Pleionea mediterranea]PWK54332.1 hypothetical protein C8D97_101180 [Pleionea mediterranea]